MHSVVSDCANAAHNPLFTNPLPCVAALCAAATHTQIAKLRAARRLWARLVKEKFKPQDEKSLVLRTHCQVGGRGGGGGAGVACAAHALPGWHWWGPALPAAISAPLVPQAQTGSALTAPEVRCACGASAAPALPGVPAADQRLQPDRPGAVQQHHPHNH